MARKHEPSAASQATLDALDVISRYRVRNAESPPGTQAPLVLIDRRVRALLPRLDAGRPDHDGWPGTTTGGGRGGAELTSVESAANARAFGRIHPDPIHEHGHRVRVNVLLVAELLEKIDRDLDTIDRKTADEILEPTTCESCERSLERPRQSVTKGTVGGRLPKVMRLCHPCRWFVEDHGQLPTDEQLLRHDATGKWRVRAS